MPAVPGFELVSLLGRGGMGEVWKARQQGIDRWVALKILHPQFSQDEEYVRRFQREARTVGRLSHENIVRAYDCGQVNGRNYLVMEFVEGEPLDRILGRRRLLPEREALGIVRPIARALEHAWKNRVIHRDIKPQNILVTPVGVPKLCDLGLSRDLAENTKLTQTGAIACTPAYASPEQAQGESGIDTRTDVYSLGVVLYQLVTGTLPFESPSATALLLKHVSEKPPPPVSRNPALSPGMNRLILDMLEKLPSRRPAEMGAVVSRIDALLSGKEEPAGHPTKISATRRHRAARSPASRAPVLAVAGGIAAAVLVLIVIASAGGGSPPRKPPPPPPREPARETAEAPPPKPLPVADPKPSPAPPAPPKPAPAADERARLALGAARTFCASTPDDLPAQIRKYESALLDLAGTPLFPEAQRELEAIRSRRAEALAKIRSDVEGVIRAAVEREEFRTAIQAWREAVAKHPDAPWAANPETRTNEIKRLAGERYPTLVQQAAEANRKGDAAAVEAVRKRVLAWGLPGLTQGFEQAIALPAAPAPVPAPPPAPAPVAPPSPPSRPKPPAASELRPIRDRVRGLFKADYAKKDRDEVRALAIKLMEAARKSEEDPATRFVFLQEARDQAIRCADASLACSAVERIVVEFEVDAKKEWSDSLRAMAASARDPASAEAFVAESLARTRAAIAADEYDLGSEFLKHAETVASRGGDPATASALIQAGNDLRKARTAFKTAQPAFEKLRSDPENADAHLEVGKFLCFAKGDWKRGGGHLERGSDRTLREAAARERLAETDPARLATAADGWIRVSGARDHAVDLYRLTWPQLGAERRDSVRDHLLKASVHEGAAADAPPAGWYIGSGSRQEGYRLDRSRSRSGKGSLRVESGGSEGWMSVGPFDTAGGKEFEFSAWTLTDRTEPWNLCSVFFYTGPPSGNTIITGFHLPAPADQPWWTPVRVRIKAPPAAKALMIMVTQGMPKGTAWVDDLSLRALDTEKELVSNGAFEK